MRDRKVTVSEPSPMDKRDGFYRDITIGHGNGDFRINLTKGEYDQLVQQLLKDVTHE